MMDVKFECSRCDQSSVTNRAGGAGLVDYCQLVVSKTSCFQLPHPQPLEIVGWYTSIQVSFCMQMHPDCFPHAGVTLPAALQLFWWFRGRLLPYQVCVAAYIRCTVMSTTVSHLLAFQSNPANPLWKAIVSILSLAVRCL